MDYLLFPAFTMLLRRTALSVPGGIMPGGSKQESKGLNVLMVDDDESITQLYKRFLDKRGHKTTGVDNLSDALNELSQKPFDIVLADVNIPGADGISIIRAIREAGYTLPAIMLSGTIYNIDIQTLKPLGVLCAIEKSGDMQPLLNELTKLLADK